MSKIKFGTDGWRAIIADDFTVENVARVTVGLARWLKQPVVSLKATMAVCQRLMAA